MLASIGDAAAFAFKAMQAVTAEPMPPSLEGNQSWALGDRLVYTIYNIGWLLPQRIMTHC